MKKKCKINDTLYILPKITDIDGITPGFLTWTKDITFKDRTIILPDDTELDALIWLNNQHQFDHGSYTHFLLDYYNDNVN